MQTQHHDKSIITASKLLKMDVRRKRFTKQRKKKVLKFIANLSNVYYEAAAITKGIAHNTLTVYTDNT